MIIEEPGNILSLTQHLIDVVLWRIRSHQTRFTEQIGQSLQLLLQWRQCCARCNFQYPVFLQLCDWDFVADVATEAGVTRLFATQIAQ